MKFTSFFQSKSQRTYLLYFTFIVLFISITYYPSLDVPFMFDDYPNIVLNQSVHPENFLDIKNAVLAESPVLGKFSRRPLAMISFAINYWLDGPNEFGFHLVNIFIHICNTLLLYNILFCLQKSTNCSKSTQEDAIPSYRIIAFWAAIIWALNPVQHQAVIYIVQRMTSMAALFYLMGIYVYIKWKEKSISGFPTFILIACCFVLGMACKPILFTMPLAIWLLDYLCFSASFKRIHLYILLLAVSSIALLSIPYAGEIFVSLDKTYPNRNFSPLERIMTEWRVVWFYLSLFFLPLPQRLLLTYDIEISRSILQPWTTLASLFSLAATFFLAWRYRKKYKLAVFGLFFFFLALAVESSHVDLEIAFIHRIYLPTAFLVFSIFTLLPKNQFKKINIALLLLISALSIGTIERIEDWKQGPSFWKNEVGQNSTQVRSLTNQAANLIDRGSFSEAIIILEKGLKTGGTIADQVLMLTNLGRAYFFQKQWEQALRVFNRISKDYRLGYYNETDLFIAQILVKQGKIEEAEQYIEPLLNGPGTRYQGRILEATLLKEKKNYEQALKIIKQTIQEEPAGNIELQVKLRLELASIYFLQKNAKQAYETYLEITSLSPQNLYAWKVIYLMLMSGNDIENANKIKTFLQSKGVSVD